MNKLLLFGLLLVGIVSPVIVVSGSATAVDLFSNTCDKYIHDNGGKTENVPVACQDVERQNNSDKNPIITIIRAAVTIISFAVGVAAVIGIIVSGIRLMTSSGDTNSISAARSGLLYSLVGIAITLIAQILVIYVLNNVK